MVAGRPTHGEFDVGLVAHLAAEGGPALDEYVSAALQSISPGAHVADTGAAIDVADAICDVLGLTNEARGELDLLAGFRSASLCAHYLVSPEGEILRDRFEGERPGPCGLGCGEGLYLFERGPSPQVAKIIRDWRLCGGPNRTCWPRSGGLDDQDAATVWWFQRLDEAARLAARRRPD